MKQGNIKLLIFDFDGTVANTLPHIVNCMIKCVKNFNLREISQDDIERYNGAVLVNVLKELGARDDQLNDIRKYYDDIFFDEVSDIKLYDGVFDSLNELKQKGFVLTLASNRGRKTMIPLLEALGISNIFDKIVCESDVENKKPSPDMVGLILEELHFKKEDALVIGDTKFDILMSNNAGTKSCYVCYDNKKNKDILALKPDCVIGNFKELISLLDE